MSTPTTNEQSQLTADTATLEDAYLAIPDEQNPAIVDARKTYLSVIALAILFIGAAFMIIL